MMVTSPPNYSPLPRWINLPEGQYPFVPRPLAGEGAPKGWEREGEGAGERVVSLKDHAKYLRRYMTDAETKLWYHLRDHRFAGLKFKRQKPIGAYIADFVCMQQRLIIELDGGQHLESDSDRRRDAWLTEQGFRVLRFWNNDVLLNIDAVLEAIYQAVLPSPPTPLPQAGEGSSSAQPSALLCENKENSPLTQTKQKSKAPTSPRPLAGEGAGERAAASTIFVTH